MFELAIKGYSVDNFTFEDLNEATYNFDPSFKIGQGGFGAVYKGILKDGYQVAAKILCAELLENNSLERALLARKSHSAEPNWKRRLEILHDIAQGLVYLQEGTEPRIVDGDLKPGNILLDKDFAPKIGDFGLAKLSPDSFTHMSTKLAGTTGYLAPKYVLGCQLALIEEADVYSFGVLLFETLCGRISSTSSWGTTQKVPMERMSENATIMQVESSNTFCNLKAYSKLEGYSLRKFSRKELQLATYYCHPSTKVVGLFGNVYKGILEDGKQVAVKALCAESKQGVLEFTTEINTISNVRHRNLVKLIGCCVEGAHRYLVYGFFENNSLERALSARKSHTAELWKQRLKICMGVAQALDYLHEGIKPRFVVHREIKSSNILLDMNWTAKISDFGLSKLRLGSTTHISTTLAGTTGYIDPEYISSGQLTSKASDVYSFGVVLFELLCGRISSTSSWGTTQKVPLGRLRNRGLYGDFMDEPLDTDDDNKFRTTKIEIFIKTKAGKTISVLVGTSDTIRSLKLKIPPSEWIHRGDLPDLVYNGEYLNDNRTLDSYNISLFSTLECQLGLKISIRTMSGKTVSVEVDSSNTTIGNLKAKIQDMEGVHQYKQKLFFDGRQLENYCTLADYKIEDGSTLLLVPRLKGWINIYVKTDTVKPISLEVKSSDTIGDVKVKITDMVGVPPFNQNFFFVGDELLDDDRTLYDYHIHSDSTLSLVPVCRGRMKINVETVCGNTIPLDVISRFTIREVKSLTQDKEGIPTHNQTLVYAGQKLDDSRTLVYYLIQNETTLRLVDDTLMRTELMQIHVEIVATRKTIPLQVETFDTIKSVKSKIQSQEDIPYEQQRLFLPQIQLKDDCTLADYYIQNGSTLHLFVKNCF